MKKVLLSLLILVLCLAALSCQAGLAVQAASLDASQDTSAQTTKTAENSTDDFVFAIQADSHLDDHTEINLYKQTLQNIVSVKPSLLMDLGDTFMAEKNGVSTQQQVNKRYTEARGYFDLLGSIPLYLVTGNHEGENGWEPEIQTMARAARLQYFPADTTLSGYSGDTQTANYYTFLQGGAQFMVLDPFTFSAQRAKGDTDGWNYTLGKTQYDWLKNVLKNSKAKYKFVFIHNLVGGLSKDERGGAEEAKYYEWGGYSPDGNYDFDKMRPGWGEPIQQLFVENYVTAVFHGHDHFYAHQSLDGIAYQLVPQPGTPGNSVGDAPKFGYKDGVILPSAGFLRVTVSGSGVKVEYLKSSLQSKDNMSIGDSYTINLS